MPSVLLPSRRGVRALGLVLILGVVGSPSVRAQSGADVTCRDALATAEQRYTEQAYDEVEVTVLECISHAGATDDEQVASHRLLALAFIKQDLMVEAQAAVVKLLGVNYDYEPDRLLDLPLYVALVDIVKDQLNIAARVERPDASAAVPASPAAVSTPAEEAGLVDINTASMEALDSVPGIGPAIARRILDYRVENGRFRSVAELEEVRGIGPRTLERMAPYLTAGPSLAVAHSAGGGVATATPSGDPEAPPAQALVNLNTASAAELDTLTGIGPALAGRIVEYRTEYGPFRSVSDVLQVRGIGPSKLDGFADQVTVE